MSLDKKDLERRMDGAITSLQSDLGGLRTGRASVNLLDSVMVPAYGSSMPLNQVGSVSVLDARTIAVNIWDKSVVGAADKAVRESGLGLNPVVVFGTATEVTDHDEKVAALDRLTDHILPGRMEAIRPHTDTEVRGTTVLSLPLDEWSMKVRSGPPIDDDEDMESPAWAGVLPLGVAVAEALPDPLMPERQVPPHVADWSRGKQG